MYLACNYHPEVYRLVENNIIDIDYFKFPALPLQMDIIKTYDLGKFDKFMKKLRKLRPVIIHGLNPSKHNIGSEDFIKDLDTGIVKQVLDISGSRGISLHLAGLDLSKSKDENIYLVSKNAYFLRNEFPGLDFISLENVDSFDEFGYAVDSDFICGVIKSSECDFLLDISHAYQVAKETKDNFENYLYSLPLDRTYEIHLNGWIEKGDKIMCHTKINEKGYNILESLLFEITPKILTLEYGIEQDELDCGAPVMDKKGFNERAEREIIEQVERLREII